LLHEVACERVGLEVVGRVAVGAGFIRIEAEPRAQVAAIERLRAAPDVVGNIAVLSAAVAVKEQVGVWPPSGDSANVFGQVKRAFDPAGILNAGRGPL
jgi:hypothetical protein